MATKHPPKNPETAPPKAEVGNGDGILDRISSYATDLDHPFDRPLVLYVGEDRNVHELEMHAALPDGAKVVTVDRWAAPPICPDVPLDKVRWRIDGAPNNGKARFISYIDARTASEVLDRWVGPANWQPEYEEGTLAGATVLWCHLRLWLPMSRGGTREVVRSDVSTFKKGRGRTGDDQMATGIKGLVSDAFKRAAAQAGVGRNVYQLPEVWASVREVKGGDGKVRAYPVEKTQGEIDAKLAEAGYETGRTATVDSHDVDDPPTEVDWERVTKEAIWAMVGGTGTEGDVREEKATYAKFLYVQATERTGVTDIDTEEDSGRVLGAAKTIKTEDEKPYDGEAEDGPGPVAEGQGQLGSPPDGN